MTFDRFSKSFVTAVEAFKVWPSKGFSKELLWRSDTKSLKKVFRSSKNDSEWFQIVLGNFFGKWKFKKFLIVFRIFWSLLIVFQSPWSFLITLITFDRFRFSWSFLIFFEEFQVFSIVSDRLWSVWRSLDRFVNKRNCEKVCFLIVLGRCILGRFLVEVWIFLAFFLKGWLGFVHEFFSFPRLEILRLDSFSESLEFFTFFVRAVCNSSRS